NNQALRLTTGDYSILINPDIEFTSDTTVFELITAQKKHRAGIASVQLRNPDGTVQHSVRSDPSFFSQALILLKLHILFPNAKVFTNYFLKDFNYATSGHVAQLMGAFFSISSECKNAVGLLDEQFFIWFEEVDYCMRAKQ